MQPVEIVQSKMMVALGAMFGAGVLWMGLTIRHDYWMVDGLLPAEWALIPGGTGFMMVALWLLVRPMTLSFSPSGLMYRGFFSSTKIAWQSIVGVSYWGTKRNPQIGVSLRLRSGSRLRLPSGWPMPATELANLVLKAQNHWGNERSRPVGFAW